MRLLETTTLPQNSKRKKKNGLPGEFLGGHSYIITILYGMFYICGAISGYIRSKSLLCLGISGSIGIVIILLGVGHLIEFSRGVRIEIIYNVGPLFISSAVGIIFLCFYGIGGKYMPFGVVGITVS